MSARRPAGQARRPAARWLWLTAGLLAAAVVMTLALLVAGSLGLVVAADALAVLALLITLGTAPRAAGAPATPRSRGSREPGRADVTGWTWVPGWVRVPGRVLPARAAWARARALPRWASVRLSPAGQDPATAGVDGFPAHRKISADLGWASVSRRHYDYATRRLLIRLLEARLGERHGMDPARDRDQTRRLVGDDVWPLLDPARPPSGDSQAPGVDLATLIRIVDRLEQL